VQKQSIKLHARERELGETVKGDRRSLRLLAELAEELLGAAVARLLAEDRPEVGNGVGSLA
jgi:hypothetical protein